MSQACQFITNHSEAVVVVVENEAQLAKYTQVGDLIIPHQIFGCVNSYFVVVLIKQPVRQWCTEFSIAMPSVSM